MSTRVSVRTQITNLILLILIILILIRTYSEREKNICNKNNRTP